MSVTIAWSPENTIGLVCEGHGKDFEEALEELLEDVVESKDSLAEDIQEFYHELSSLERWKIL